MKKLCRIPFQVRLDVYEDRADAAVNELVSHHLAENCSACKQDMAWLVTYMPQLRFALQHSEQSVSDWALARARRIMPSKPKGTVSRLVTATQLLFDSRIRSTAPASARDGVDGSVHVVYRTDGTDIDLWQEQTRTGNWYLTGQALSLDGVDMEPPKTATLVSETVGRQLASIENGEFSFESITSGLYLLSLQWDDLEIQVDGLTVGSAEAQ